MSALVCASGVLLCAGVASANVGAAGGPLVDYPMIVMPIIVIIETVALLIFGAQRKWRTFWLITLANLVSYIVGMFIIFLTERQSLTAIGTGMEWWWVLPWFLLGVAFVMTIAIEWPILRMCFEKERRERSVGPITLAHVASYGFLAFAYIGFADTSLVRELRVERDPTAMRGADGALLVFVDESGHFRQARSDQLGRSVPVLIDGVQILADPDASRQRSFFLHIDRRTSLAALRVERWQRSGQSNDHAQAIPVRLDREPELRSHLRGNTEREVRDWLSFYDWREPEQHAEWLVGHSMTRAAYVERSDSRGARYRYEIRPFFRARFEVTHILPGDIAICSIEPGYPVAIAWRDGWIMDLREMLGARSDIVVVYGTVGDGWPEESTNSEDAHSPEVKSDQ